jgi:3-methyladenine DNA glycosylase/8-oxoguanine DNA glycosylase
MQLCGLCQQNSQLLSPAEKRLILTQLYELQACRATVLTYEDFLRRDKEQDERETQNWARALELERQATALAVRERDLAQERATFYEQQFRSLTKRPGVGCWLKRFFSFGLVRCN